MKTPMMNPCPFCGGSILSLRQDDDGGWWRVVCYGCNAHGPNVDSLDTAVSLWNTAPMRIPIVGEVKSGKVNL